MEHPRWQRGEGWAGNSWTRRLPPPRVRNPAGLVCVSGWSWATIPSPGVGQGAAPSSKQWARSQHNAQEARVPHTHLAPRLLKHRLWTWLQALAPLYRRGEPNERSCPIAGARPKILNLLHLSYTTWENRAVLFNCFFFFFNLRKSKGKKNHQTGAIGTVGNSFVNWLI